MVLQKPKVWSCKLEEMQVAFPIPLVGGTVPPLQCPLRLVQGILWPRGSFPGGESATFLGHWVSSPTLINFSVY